MSELKGSVKNHHQELYEEKTAGSMLCAKVELQHSLLHNVHSKLMDTVKKKNWILLPCSYLSLLSLCRSPGTKWKEPCDMSSTFPQCRTLVIGYSDPSIVTGGGQWKCLCVLVYTCIDGCGSPFRGRLTGDDDALHRLVTACFTLQACTTVCSFDAAPITGMGCVGMWQQGSVLLLHVSTSFQLPVQLRCVIGGCKNVTQLHVFTAPQP